MNTIPSNRDPFRPSVISTAYEWQGGSVPVGPGPFVPVLPEDVSRWFAVFSLPPGVSGVLSPNQLGPVNGGIYLAGGGSPLTLSFYDYPGFIGSEFWFQASGASVLLYLVSSYRG